MPVHYSFLERLAIGLDPHVGEGKRSIELYTFDSHAGLMLAAARFPA